MTKKPRDSCMDQIFEEFGPQPCKQNNICMKTHQVAVARFFNEEAHRKKHALLAILDLGTGKTFAGIAAGEVLRRNRHITGVAFLTVHAQFDDVERSISKCLGKDNPARKAYKVLPITYTFGAKSHGLRLEEILVVVDEVHNFLGQETGPGAKKRPAPQVNKMDKLMTILKKAKYVLLLTATPLMYGPWNLVALARMLWRDNPPFKLPVSEKAMLKKYSNMEEGSKGFDCWAKIFKDRVLYCLPSVFKEDYMINRCWDITKFPEEVCHPCRITLDNDLFANLKPRDVDALEDIADGGGNVPSILPPELQKMVKTFQAATRQVKAECIVDIIFKYPKPAVVFTTDMVALNLIKQYIEDLADEREEDIVIGEITKNTHVNQIGEIAEEYANGEIQVLLLTDAAMEGLSLKNTRQMHVFEQQYERRKIKQAKARVVRYMSHEGLPADERRVDMFEYFPEYLEDDAKFDISPVKLLCQASLNQQGEGLVWHEFLNDMSISFEIPHDFQTRKSGHLRNPYPDRVRKIVKGKWILDQNSCLVTWVNKYGKAIPKEDGMHGKGFGSKRIPKSIRDQQYRCKKKHKRSGQREIDREKYRQKMYAPPKDAPSRGEMESKYGDNEPVSPRGGGGLFKRLEGYRQHPDMEREFQRLSARERRGRQRETDYPSTWEGDEDAMDIEYLQSPETQYQLYGHSVKPDKEPRSRAYGPRRSRDKRQFRGSPSDMKNLYGGGFMQHYKADKMPRIVTGVPPKVKERPIPTVDLPLAKMLQADTGK